MLERDAAASAARVGLSSEAVARPKHGPPTLPHWRPPPPPGAGWHPPSLLSGAAAPAGQSAAAAVTAACPESAAAAATEPAAPLHVGPRRPRRSLQFRQGPATPSGGDSDRESDLGGH